MHAAVAVTVLFQQLPSIVASCLPNAKSAEQRQNLTASGESYPIGLWVGDWDAAYVTSGVVHILLEDGGVSCCLLSFMVLPFRLGTCMLHIKPLT